MHRLSQSQLHAETDVHTQVSDAAQCRWQSQLLKIKSISCSECQTVSCGDYLEKTGTMNDFHSDVSKAIAYLRKWIQEILVDILDNATTVCFRL